jgi:hypothetical protein
MGRFQHSNGTGPVLAAAAIYFWAGLSVASMFLMLARFGPIFGGHLTLVMAVTGSLIFLCSCVLVFFRSAVAYFLGALAGGLALPWFVLTESSRFPSAWTYLNGPDDLRGAAYRPAATLKILSVALIAVAVTWSIFRLLPSRLLLRSSPLSQRTWPAIAVAVLVLAMWLQHSARPWMLPTIVDAVFPELQIFTYKSVACNSTRQASFLSETEGFGLPIMTEGCSNIGFQADLWAE